MLERELEEKRLILACLQRATIAECYNDYKLLGGHMNECEFDNFKGKLSIKLEEELMTNTFTKN